jgi:hypothetical protein
MNEIEVHTTGAQEASDGVVELWLDGEQIASPITTPTTATCCCGSTPVGTVPRSESTFAA